MQNELYKTFHVLYIYQISAIVIQILLCFVLRYPFDQNQYIHTVLSSSNTFTAYF